MLQNPTEFKTVMLSRHSYNPKGERIVDYSNVGSHITNFDDQSVTSIYVSNEENIDFIQDIINSTSTSLSVFLPSGTFVLSKPLNIHKHFISIFGESNHTFIKCEFEGTAIKIGSCTWNTSVLPSTAILDIFVPCGSRKITIWNQYPVEVGDSIRVARVGNEKWIKDIGMKKVNTHSHVMGWIPFYMEFDRIVKDITHNREFKILELDNDIPFSIEQTYGGGYVYKYIPKRVHAVHVMNLQFVSEHNGELFELDNCENVFISKCQSKGFSNFVHIGKESKYITISKCIYNGTHDAPFAIGGQLCLIRKCSCMSFLGHNAFTFDSGALGPNVIQKCSANSICEPISKWVPGALFDNCSLSLHFKSGKQGWNVVNSVIWNCKGNIICQSPSTATNFSIGTIEKRKKNKLKETGIWYSKGEHVSPSSLFEYQKDLAKTPRV
jgi:hypothetical protein